MPNLVEKTKIIRDVVHGYILLTKKDVEIIDTPHFQRLKRIRQTTSSSVYPCANHTRFEHALGVMHLGKQVFRILRRQCKDLDKKYYDTVKYACLLHDIGHAPFSHLGESFYNKSELIEKVQTGLERLGVKSDFKGSEAANHELCSCAITLEFYATLLSESFFDFDLFCRMITGETYPPGTNDIKNCLIGILNFDIDVDKLDYILRDSYMSGAKLVTLDIDRLIKSYIIYNNELAFSGQSLSTISNLIYGRDALYNWVYNHHITVYNDCLFKRLIDKIITQKNGEKDFFSYKAISQNLIDDYDLMATIRQNLLYNPTCLTFYECLSNRKFFKAIWKTPFEFDTLIPDPGHQDKFLTVTRINKLNLEKFEKSIVEKNPELSIGDFFISFAYFKPYSTVEGKSIYILLNDKRKRFNDLFQEQIYKTKRTELPYIFVKDNRVKEVILSKINEGTFH